MSGKKEITSFIYGVHFQIADTLFKQSTLDKATFLIITFGEDNSYFAEQFKISYQANHFVPVFKKLTSSLQNNFIDFNAFSDDKLFYIQDYLFITEDCDKLIIIDYNITKLIIDDQNYNINIVKDQEEYKKLVIEDQNYNVDIVKD
ncbi:hypothetical protein C1646_766996 [Rhizophagus diaphanus]|nr:hypothetical protein C1646_766996 [Rhizophagus diaphanus] [Rhizophagus sp. MUCL 43196]